MSRRRAAVPAEIREKRIASIRKELAGKNAGAVVAWALGLFHPRVALASSFSLEDIVLAAMMAEVEPDARIFAIDTGRLNEETYEAAEAVRTRLGVRIRWHFPDRAAVESLERSKGLYSFRESLENRRECCRIRKVEPLGRAVSALRAWITGQRRAHGVTRRELPVAEVDEAHGGILKLNPLADWTDDDVRAFIRARGLPYNRLHDAGYPSVGCAPCTRAVLPGEDLRAGRWWWESAGHKECGLHARAGAAAPEPEGEE